MALGLERRNSDAIATGGDPASDGALRVVMVVANDVTRDSRVLREAGALAAAGHHVTVLGIHTARTTAPPVETRDGFVIRRLPFRARPPSWWVPPNYRDRLRARVERQLTLHRARLTAIRRRLERRAPRGGVAAWARAGAVALHGARLGGDGPRPTSRRRRRSIGSRGRAVRAAALRLVRSPVSAWPGKFVRTGGRLRRRLAWRARRALRSRASARSFIAGIGRGVAAVAVVPLRVLGALGRVGRPYATVVMLGVWGSSYLLANRLSGGAIEWLTGWRWRWLGWARYVAQHAPDADVWHGHDFTSLPAIVELKRRRGGMAVYDTHEIYLESGRSAGHPRWAKEPLERLERRLAAEVDAVVTVNDSLATVIGRRLGRRDVEVVYNCPGRRGASVGTLRLASPLRRALRLTAEVPLALYHGSFSPHRGIEQLLEAMLLPPMTGVHVALLGHGSLQGWLTEEASDARYGGRLHVVEGVPPDVLLDWLVGVDVAVAPIQPSTLNHWYSSPNKVFEAIAVGIPVAGSDFPEFRRVIADAPGGPLGVLFDPTEPVNIATAVRGLLDLPEPERAAMQRRCAIAAERRWNWEIESRRLLDVYDALGARTNLVVAEAAA
jgi:glycosyltransferase involved in cell wall biosynthesis